MVDDTRTRATASRRTVLATVAAGTVGLAGCLGGGGTSEGASDPPVRGDPDAGVTLEAFEDFACGACRAYTLEGFPSLRSSHIEPGAIRYEFRNFPFIGDESFEAANAARAAYVEGGNDAFWEFKTRVMENQASLPAASPGLFGDIAVDLGLERGVIETAATEQSYEGAVSADKSRGEDLGVESTPSFAIDGDLVDTSEAMTVGGLVRIVQEELDEALEDESGGGGY